MSGVVGFTRTPDPGSERFFETARRFREKAHRNSREHSIQTMERKFDMTYERPTLAKAGGFRRTTGLAGQTAKDLLGGHQLV
ncbi:hypothetical protein GCM10027168_52500 [Streptomyces capparidis]